MKDSRTYTVNELIDLLKTIPKDRRDVPVYIYINEDIEIGIDRLVAINDLDDSLDGRIDLEAGALDTAVYSNEGNDQPATCPRCGSRTNFIELGDAVQQHKCLGCKYEFVLSFEED